MLARDPLIELLESFPGSTFWIDEAYVHYIATSAGEASK